jgi:HD-GYP domain-containing protein (c-di-GMP phosphodiesterase class II)
MGTTDITEPHSLAYGELSLAFDATIESLSKALDLRENIAPGHSARVAENTIRLARRMGVPEDRMVHIRRGCWLHDFGKIGIPDTILKKTGSLTTEEWGAMHEHPKIAYEFLWPIIYLRPSIDIPWCHHEKWDGTGYPRGLAEDEIPFDARIFAVIDTFEILTSDRPYRLAWSEDKAIEYIMSQSGLSFDPAVVAAFMVMASEDRKLRRKTGSLGEPPPQP